MPRSRSYSKFVLAIGLSTTLLGGTLALAAQTSPAALTPRQVADKIDSITQPRFRQTMGRFGVDRVMMGTHAPIYNLLAHTSAEKSVMQQVNVAHRPYALGFLHCARRPGAGAYGKRDDAEGRKPWTAPLVAAGTSSASAYRIYYWADAHLDGIVLPHIAALRRGEAQEATQENWLVVMRPVRASSASCLSCHVGAKRGDTLGVMLYMVDKNVMPVAPKSLTSAGEGGQ